MMGSGAMVVMDENTCMVEVARYFLSFTADDHAASALHAASAAADAGNLDKEHHGLGTLKDLERLERIGSPCAATSLCGLGTNLP